MKNIGLAIVCSTFAVAICTFLTGVGEQPAYWRISAAIAGVAGVVSFVVLVFITLPLHYALTRIGKVGSLWYILPGMLTGPMFVLSLKPFGQDTVPGLALQSLYCGFLGTVGAAMFWYIAVWQPRQTG